MISLNNFRPDIAWIAKRLKISNYQTQTAVEALFKHNLLEEEDGRWKKKNFKLRFSTCKSKESVRAFHKSMIEKAVLELSKVDQESFSKRLITGICVAANPAHIERAKQRLDEALFEVSQILSEGECTELFQINAQLFQLTKSEEIHVTQVDEVG